MKRNRHTLILSRIALMLVALFAGLWSWNTLAELFNAPHAQFRHVIATLVLLLSLRWVLLPDRHGKKGSINRQETGAL
jgi:hypothetical protein